MYTEKIVTAAVFTLAGLLVAFLGFRVRSRGQVDLIAGYDARQIRDPAGLSRLVGAVCFALGAISLAVAAAIVVWPAAVVAAVIGLSAAAVAGIIVILVSRSRYERMSLGHTRPSAENRDPAA